VDNATLKETIRSSLKDWGKTGQQYMEAVFL